MQGLKQFSIEQEKQEDGGELLFQIRVIQSFLKEMNLKKS